MINNEKLTDWAEYFDAVLSSTLVYKRCMENLFKLSIVQFLQIKQ